MRFLLLLILIATAIPSQASIQTLNASSPVKFDKMVLLDARTIAQCLDSSVSEARCLPAGTFYSKQHGLASFHHINWVLSTLGLSENDHLLVFADNSVDRDAVAGLLFLAGQLKVSRWDGETKQLQSLLGAASGQARGATRTHIYAGTTRDAFISLAQEIPALQQAGWTILSTQLASDTVPENTIVSADSPMIAIAIFAKLLANGHQTLKLVIDTLALKNDRSNKIVIWLMPILAAMLLTFILWNRRESINHH